MLSFVCSSLLLQRPTFTLTSGFAQTGLDLKSKSPFKPTFTIELANGSYGYLPTPEQHQLGGYETWLGTNRLEVEASDKMLAALLEMAAEMGSGQK